MAYTHNSQQYLPPYYHQNMQFPCTFIPLEQQPAQSFVPAAVAASYPLYPIWFGQNRIQNRGGNSVVPTSAGSWNLQPIIGVPKEPQRTVLDQQKTKIARIKRKIERQKSICLQRNASSRVSSSAQLVAWRLAMYGLDSHRDQFDFCMLDNKNSDVGSLGRIILPKREAEENLPSLFDKEGIQVVLKDLCSDKVWTLKFKRFCKAKQDGDWRFPCSLRG